MLQVDPLYRLLSYYYATVKLAPALLFIFNLRSRAELPKQAWRPPK